MKIQGEYSARKARLASKRLIQKSLRPRLRRPSRATAGRLPLVGHLGWHNARRNANFVRTHNAGRTRPGGALVRPTSVTFKKVGEGREPDVASTVLGASRCWVRGLQHEPTTCCARVAWGAPENGTSRLWTQTSSSNARSWSR